MDPDSITKEEEAGARAIALLKKVEDALKESDHAGSDRDLAEARLALMVVLAKNKLLVSENRELRYRVRELEETLARKQALHFHHSVFWCQLPEGSLEGPYSPSHWELEGKLVRMQVSGPDSTRSKIHFYEPGSKETAEVPVKFLREQKVPCLDEALSKDPKM